ncbi:TetR/AcrR family transcriptional regulator [Oleiagrimonas sp. C23AA]|uniref:TetR/AcrR family transcriptional regulator n=1 Tax=Oleiagrimonas sp. C23AA TaxID=2719047 RepID=UPI00141DA6A8|nr:TetR/AcrR family transcriptional regulator [Oleiagrimonas sp. C23AA]NII10357.1 TetR/AcrR family transcriptional regulator [Oleiagrimonas sp. C23AA]
MDIDSRLLAAAERLFDHEGFNATGMGRVVEASGLSSRTVYKHAAGKHVLMAMVLRARQRRFFAQADFRSTRALFASLRQWVRQDGARGCLFFRVRAETGARTPLIEQVVADYHAQLHASITAMVAGETGTDDAMLCDQILALFEGATAAATYRGDRAIEAASDCACQLIEAKRPA